MTIAAIFAAGLGSPIANPGIPTPYLPARTPPLIAHTVEKFLVHPQIDRVVVLTPRSWLGFTQDCLKEHLPKDHGVVVMEGGETRNGTLQNALAWVAAQFGTQEDHVIVTHDAVRPFVTHRIISDNITAAREHGACDTVIPATDTIVQSQDGAFISDIPPRSQLFQGQTPQSFCCNKLRQLMDSLTPQEETTLTDACKIFTLRGEPVALVQGEVHNIKITYPYDLKVAFALLGMDEEVSGK